MATDQRGLRTDSVRIKLSPEMLLRVEKIAEGYGMPTATLAAFAVAQFVQQQEAAASMTRLAALEMARSAVGAEFPQELIEKVMGSMATQLLASQVLQPSLPLDVEAPAKGA